MFTNQKISMHAIVTQVVNPITFAIFIGSGLKEILLF